jgi:hypothetical protein
VKNVNHLTACYPWTVINRKIVGWSFIGRKKLIEEKPTDKVSQIEVRPADEFRETTQIPGITTFLY